MGLKEWLLYLIYPPRCLHCSASLANDQNYFCLECASKLELVKLQNRCPTCFADLDGCFRCPICRHRSPLLKGIAAAFDYVGVAQTLLKQFKHGAQPYLAKSAASFLIMQFFRLDWPLPDLIVPLPQAVLHGIERGYNQSLLLAEVVGSLLERPVVQLLKKEGGKYSQTGLNRRQRQKNVMDTLSLKKKNFQYADQTVLLIDDVFTTGSTLQSAAHTLLKHRPASIYALTLCRSPF